MSANRPVRLFDLLPAVYRVGDAQRGDVLRALFGVMQEEFERLEADVERLYDNWFAETCDEWVVSYLGDLLGVTGLRPAENGVFSQRAFVANTLAYRRAKGTAAVLELLARDLTGWTAKVVEYFDLLATTGSMNHRRRSDIATFEVRDANRAELVGSPLEEAAHTAEVRRVANRRGRYAITNVGLHLWRLQPYYVSRATARPVRSQLGRAGRFTFDPLGQITPLFNVPRAETATAQLALEANVPARLRRRPLHDELEARRQALVDHVDPSELYFDDSQPVVRVWIEREADGASFWDPVAPEELVICDLSDRPAPARGWRRPPVGRSYRPRGGGPAVSRRIKAAVDPVLGRLSLPVGDLSRNVEVSYAYGFAGDLGGGPYSRRESVADALLGGTVAWQRGVTRDPPAGVGELGTSLRQAVEEWNRDQLTLRPGEIGVIALLDSRTYQENLDIEIAAGRRLLIVAADWPVDLEPDDVGREQRSPGRLTPDARRPHLRGTIRVHGTAPNGASPGGLTLDGLLVERGLTVLPGNLGELRVAHCTLIPRGGELTVRAGTAAEGQNNQLAVMVLRSISGPLRVDRHAARLKVEECIIDGRGESAVAGPDTDVIASTILGRTNVRSLSASNAIFTGEVAVDLRQRGCVRYCFLPRQSVVPRRSRCQPPGDGEATGTEAEAGIAPAFTSTTYGHAAYCQLAETCPSEIVGGADDEGELGAFHFLQQPRRVADLTARLHEYLPFGLEAGVFFAT